MESCSIMKVHVEVQILLSLQMFQVLKQQCHKDFAALGQFCAKITTLWGFNHKQNVSVKLHVWQRYQMNFIRDG